MSLRGRVLASTPLVPPNPSGLSVPLDPTADASFLVLPGIGRHRHLRHAYHDDVLDLTNKSATCKGEDEDGLSVVSHVTLILASEVHTVGSPGDRLLLEPEVVFSYNGGGNSVLAIELGAVVQPGSLGDD